MTVGPDDAGDGVGTATGLPVAFRSLVMRYVPPGCTVTVTVPCSSVRYVAPPSRRYIVSADAAGCPYEFGPTLTTTFFG